ncbi:fluoride efflux transporter CrcB [Rodentibacter caecimuris]|uniref:fluoride efflux transporter CrcB n=1 Tax=Rodentibacter caecimuris TaxID=1796644 RepID=UPI0009857A39
MWKTLCLISGGAAFGACFRWGFSTWLNPLFTTFSFGTLIANLFGCFLGGLFLGAISQFPQLSVEWRSFIMTGFLGSLTTFSSFSNEVIAHFSQQHWIQGFLVLALHLIGCLSFTALGLWCCKFFI